MPLPRLKFFLSLAMIVAVSTPGHAQSSRVFAVAGVGMGGTQGGNLQNDFSLTAELLLGNRVAIRRGTTLMVAVAGGMDNYFGEDCVVTTASFACAPSMPNTGWGALLGGAERRGALGSASLFLGPGVVRSVASHSSSFKQTSALALAGRAELALRVPKTPFSIAAAARSLVTPNFLGRTVNIYNFSLGLRVQ